MCDPAPRPISWIGKAGAGSFPVDVFIGGEWKSYVIPNHNSYMKTDHLYRFLRLAALSLAGIVLLSCEELFGPRPEPEPDPVEEVTVRNYTKNDGEEVVEMGEQTIFVRSDLSKTLTGYDEAKGILTFSESETLERLNIKVGDYLYSNEQTERFPDGYCFKVISVPVETKARTRYGPGDVASFNYGVEPANIVDAIEYCKEIAQVDWDKMSTDNVSVFDIFDMPDFVKIDDGILDKTVFKKRPLGDKLSIVPGRKKSSIEYVIWESSAKSQAGYGKVKEADMKLVVALTLDHEFYDGLEFELNHGKVLIDTDIECGVTVNLKFKIDGKNFNQEEMSKEDRKAFLEEFERTGARTFGKMVQICSFDFPMNLSTVIIRPKIDILWDFRIEKIGGEFSFTVGYTGAKYNFHLENRAPWSTKLEGEVLTCLHKPEWVADFTGELKGTIATGPAAGITFEIPGMRYSGEYKNVRQWKNYKGRSIPAFAGCYLELLLEGDFKLTTKYETLDSKLLTTVTLGSKLKLDAVEEHLLGFGKLLVGHDQWRLPLLEWKLGDLTWELLEIGDGEYCISPEVGAYVPEGEAVRFEWGSSRDKSESNRYDLYFGTDPNQLRLIAESLGTTSYKLKASETGGAGKRYWKVVAVTPSGQKLENEVWSFTIGDNPGDQTTVMVPIDLGLPSGMMWGDRNLGAKQTSEAGFHYAWGGLTKVTGPTYWTDYRFSDGTESVMTKYNRTDMLTVLESADDIATVGSERAGWRMPVREEWEELLTYCNWTYSERGGVPGYVVTNEETGAYIFLPVITDYYGKDGPAVSDGALYWTSSRNILNNVSLADAVRVKSPGKMASVLEPRYYGLMVRPVFTGNAAPGLAVDYQELNFEDVGVDMSKPRYLAVTNVGYSALYFDIVGISDAFSCEEMGKTITLKPGQTHVYTINFQPTEMRSYTGKLLIGSNAPGGVTTVELKGVGVSKSDGGLDDVPGHNL